MGGLETIPKQKKKSLEIIADCMFISMLNSSKTSEKACRTDSNKELMKLLRKNVPLIYGKKNK